MKKRYFAFAALLAVAFSIESCTFASIDTDNSREESGGSVTENGYIKSISVGKVAPATEGTKTLFHTDEENYGLTTWEAGENGYVDQLSFILRDPDGQYAYLYDPEYWQVFKCDYSFEKYSYEYEEDGIDEDIKWGKFSVQNGGTGLTVGGNYYAYYMNGREEEAIYDYLVIDSFDQNGQTDESLQSFMREYDYLELEENQHDGCATANGGIIAESLMKDVYMYHYFSLIEVDLHWVRDITMTNKAGVTTIVPMKKPFNTVQFGSGDDPKSSESGNGVFIYAFAGRVGLDGFGQLELTGETSFVTNHRLDPSSNVILTESNNVLKYYFLIHPLCASNHYWIKVLTDENAVTIHYKLPGMFEFKRGYYYKYDLDADFGKMKTNVTTKEWQDRGALYDRDSTYLKSKNIQVYYENN